jgi:hypothetical protein
LIDVDPVHLPEIPAGVLVYLLFGWEFGLWPA